jgi:hypothetical protein
MVERFNGRVEREVLGIDERQPSCPAPSTILAAASSRREGVARP